MSATWDFSKEMYKLPYKERNIKTRSLVEMRKSGMTYQMIASILGHNQSSISQYLKVYEAQYDQTVRDNIDKIRESISTVDPDYAYMTDPRTVMQNMSAMHMGREVMFEALNALANLPEKK